MFGLINTLCLAALLGVIYAVDPPLRPWGVLSRHWDPLAGGCCVGLAQLPLILGLGKTLGMSGTYGVFSSFLIPSRFHPAYFRKLRGGVDIWWLPLMAASVAGGAALAAFALTSPMAGPLPLQPGRSLGGAALESFFGGMVAIMGGSIGGGCTSGHGLSGMGHLVVKSYVAVACMFASGIATAFIYKAAQGH